MDSIHYLDLENTEKYWISLDDRLVLANGSDILGSSESEPNVLSRYIDFQKQNQVQLRISTIRQNNSFFKFRQA